jgi:hypothetical protein
VQDAVGSDGATVGVGSNLVTYFSASLATGLTSNQLRETFSIQAGAEALTNAGWAIHYDVVPGLHALRATLPNLYNGNPDTLHLLSVTFTRTGFPTLVAERSVLAAVDEDSNDDGIPDAWEAAVEHPGGQPVGHQRRRRRRLPERPGVRGRHRIR